MELASRAQTQAQKFGARLAVSRNVVRLDCDQNPFTMVLEDGSHVLPRTVVIASGARYRKLRLPHYEQSNWASTTPRLLWRRGCAPTSL